MTHTATPWTLVQHELFSGAKVIGGVKDANGDSIRVTGFALSGGDVSEANAHFIVRACNAHDDLVKALERIARPHDCGCGPCTGQCASKEALDITLDSIRDLACAALAKVAA